MIDITAVAGRIADPHALAQAAAATVKRMERVPDADVPRLARAGMLLAISSFARPGAP